MLWCRSKYLVEVNNGVLWRRHVDLLKQLEPRRVGDVVSPDHDEAQPDVLPDQGELFPCVPSAPEAVAGTAPSTGPENLARTPSPGAGTHPSNRQQPPAGSNASHPYPQRTRNLPDWFGEVVTH